MNETNTESSSHPHFGLLILSLATLIWGSTFIVTKETLQNTPAATIVFARFLIAGIVFVPFLRPGRALWLAALELGTWLWLGFATQTIGLNYTTVDRSAFITALHVVFVPALGALVGKNSRPTIWLAAILALLGVGLLSHDGSPPNLGDLWSLACALSFAFYIFRLEKFTAQFPSNPLTAAQLWIVVALSAIWTLSNHQMHGPIPWKAVLYLGLAATAATTWFQTLGQRHVTAPQAAVIYTLEPVWAAVFAFLILHQIPGSQGWIGAAMILTAAALTQIPKTTPGIANSAAINPVQSRPSPSAPP